MKYKKKTDDFCSLIFRFKTDRWQTCDTDIQQINHGLCFTGWKHTCYDVDEQQNTRWFSHSVLQRENIIVPNLQYKQKTDEFASRFYKLKTDLWQFLNTTRKPNAVLQVWIRPVTKLNHRSKTWFSFTSLNLACDKVELQFQNMILFFRTKTDLFQDWNTNFSIDM